MVSGQHSRNHCHFERRAWPDTQMSRAFLIALGRWLLAHHDDVEARITLPIGVVGGEELTNVLRALERAQEQTNYASKRRNCHA